MTVLTIITTKQVRFGVASASIRLNEDPVGAIEFVAGGRGLLQIMLPTCPSADGQTASTVFEAADKIAHSMQSRPDPSVDRIEIFEVRD